MSEQKFEEDRISSGKFYMFRCLIVMAHADGVFSEEERSYMYSLMDHSRINLTSEQYKTLESDMDAPQNIADLLPYLHDPEYRSQLLYFARLMAHKDGHKHPNEEDLLNKIQAHTAPNTDLDMMRAEAKEALARDLSGFGEGASPKGSWLETHDKVMESININLMDD